LRATGLIIGGASVGGGFFGCSTSSPQSTPTARAGTSTRPKALPTSGPKPGGTVTLLIASQMTTLNPGLSGNGNTTQYVYDRLLNVDWVNGKYELSLAQSLENPDPLTYIFKIKPTAKFQNVAPVNGRPVTSEDVVASWNAFVANPRTANKGVFTQYIDKYETPDASTLVVKMKKAYAWVLGVHNLGGPAPSTVVPKELTTGDALDKTAIGPGPYVLEEYDPASTIAFKRRPDGWHTPDRPYIDRVVGRVITDTAAHAAAFKSKQIDELAARDKLEADEFKSYGPDVVVDRALGISPWLMMRADEQGYFKDPRVREAVYNALDIQELIEVVELGEGEYVGPVPAYLKTWVLPRDELKTYFPHDLKKAKDLLTGAGWDTNREVELKHSSADKSALMCQILQRQLAAAGIRTRLVPQDPTVFRSQTYQTRDFQLAGVRDVGGYDPDIHLRYQTTSGGGAQNLCRWSDADVDQIVTQQQTEFDLEKQKQIILDAQRLILKKFAPLVLLYAPYTYTARWSYYHPAQSSDNGFVGVFGHYSWTEKP